jgi:hypothetical protein
LKVKIAQGFHSAYVDGTTIDGDYVTDTVTLSGSQLTGMEFGLANSGQSSNQITGIMGIGFNAGEFILQTDATAGYPNIVNQLKNQGYINTMAYSLWLDDLTSKSGSILFGGVDTARYSGQLVGLPIQPDSQTGTLSSFTVALTAVNLVANGKTSLLSSSSMVAAAVLDSGTTNTLLPDDVANAILNGVGATTDPYAGNVVSCDLANADGSFSFQFGGTNGPTIAVPIAEFVTIPLTDTQGQPITFPNGPNRGKTACAFGIEAAGARPILLGDTFLRSAYVVYDLENMQLAIAQTNFNPGSANVQEFSGASIPGVSSIASAATVAATDVGGFNTGGATPQPTAVATTDINRSATFGLTTRTGSAVAPGSAAGTGSSGGPSSNAAAPRGAVIPGPSGGSMATIAVAAAGVLGGMALVFF